MRILGKYIGNNIVRAIASVLFALLAIFSFFGFMGEIDDVGTGNFDWISAVYVVFLEVPKLTYDLIPFATLIGSMIALGDLTDSNELTAIRVAGGSKGDFAKTIFRSSAVLIIFALALGELIVPFSEERASHLKLALKNDSDLTITGSGYWARDNNNFIRIGDIFAGQKFSDITIYEFDDRNHLKVVISASSASFDSGFWFLNDANLTTFDGASVDAEKRKRLLWPSKLDPKVVEMVATKSSNYTLLSLYRYWRFARNNNQKSDRLERIFWDKMVCPLGIFALMGLSFGLSFGNKRSSSASRRVLLGAGLGLFYHVSCQLFSQAAIVYSIAPFVGVVLPPIIVLILAAAFQERAA